MSDIFYTVMNKLLKECNFYETQKIAPKSEIKFIGELREELFQLPSELDYSDGGNQQKHANNPYKGMFINNPYLKLYKYLQTSSDFKEIQTKILKLHMGLFAYADRDIKKLRYLYGPCDRPEDREKSTPHFFLRAYWYNNVNNAFEDEPQLHFDTLLRAFYYGRISSAWQDIDFIKLLEKTEDAADEVSCRRTKFEHENGVIYAPSGEMDACILCCLLLTLEENMRTNLLTEIANNYFVATFSFNLKPIKPKPEQEKGDRVWYESENNTLIKWLEILGLIEQLSGPSFKVTERGKHMAFWLGTYLKSLNGENINILGAGEQYFFKIIGSISKPETPWLKGFDTEINSFLEERDDNKKFLAAVKLLLSWNEGNGLTIEERAMQFRHRCRFNLYGHLVLRSGDRGGLHEKNARAWIVFPVLADEESEKDKSDKLINVGFFLGTFKDSTDNGESYFENYELCGTELKEIISKTKIIINILASVENREIYYKEVQRQHIIKHGERAAIASIMGRNMSHNIGSHVLSDIKYDDFNNISKPVPKATRSKIRKLGHEFSTFHAYMQKRMDLIARITGKTPGWGEPMYFIGDLLKGFFNQSLLLNHLVEDQGKKWKETGIEFLLQINENEASAKATKVTFNYIKTTKINKNGKEEEVSTYSWRPSDGSNFEDFLVSIPDGNIGAQAFYIFMESLMRNSAKYGEHRHKEEKFTININVTSDETNEKDSYYRLKIFDNLSGCNGNLIEEIRDKIKEPLIDEKSGELAAKSLGIAEMREACNFLINQDSKDFPANIKNKNVDSWKPYPLWAECKSQQAEPKDNCHSSCDESEKFLSYTFNLLKPQMVAIVEYDTKTIKDNDQFGIKNISIDDLVKRAGAYQFAVIFMNENNKEIITERIKKDHQYLPQRLIIVNCTGDSITSTTGKMPHKRRAVICSEDDITDDGDCESFILKVYEIWIKKRWLNGSKAIDLYVTFERVEDNSLLKQWEKVTTSEILKNEATLTVMQIENNAPKVYSVNGKDYQRPISNSDTQEKVELYYDNHGVASKNSSPYFKHETGGSNKKIFETLSSPPQNQFGFDYFLLGLIEAGLTKVAIVDERVAQGTNLTNNTKAKNWQQKDFKQFLNVNCIPLFQITLKDDANRTNGFLTDAVKQQVEGYVHNDEGLIFEKSNGWKISYAQDKGKCETVKPDFLDFLVIHSGIIETKITKDMKMNKGDDSINALYKLVPSIILTSGRGTVNKELPFSDSPFVEFSMLKENLYPSISKYHLVRTLMSAKGNKE